MEKGKIFIRERRKVQEGEKRPRYTVVAVAGTDLKIKAKHLRTRELEEIADHIGAELVYLKKTKDEEEIDDED